MQSNPLKAEGKAAADIRVADADQVTALGLPCFYAGLRSQPNLLPLRNSKPCRSHELLWPITVLLDRVRRDRCDVDSYIAALLADHA